MELKEALSSIGLTKGEVDVYTALLELGLSTTGDITKKANISSSKVYEVLQRLMAKGLASYIIKRGIKHFAASPAHNILQFLEDKKTQLTEGQETLKKIIPEIEKRRIKQELPEAVVYQGRQGPLIALNAILEADKSGKEILGYGTDEDDFFKLYPAQILTYIEEQKKIKNSNMRLLFGEGYNLPNPTAKIRFLPRSLEAPVRTVVFGNKVAIIDFSEKCTTIIIEKKGIAEAYRKQFNLLWNIAKER